MKTHTQKQLLLATASIAAITIGLSGCAHRGGNPAKHSERTLKGAFMGSFFVGVAVNQDQFTGKDTRGAAIVLQQFNSLSPENVLKWESVHPQPDKYDFEAADRYVQFAEANGIYIVGHTLVWHNQTPPWVFQAEGSTNVVDRDTLLQRMRDHIRTVVGRYKGRVHEWDVVNEAILADGSWRQTPWYTIIGEEFVARAFQYAHETDPAARLNYNDYALEDTPKRNGVIAMIRKLQAQGVPITGIGSQMHVKLQSPTLEQTETALSELEKLNLKVMVTELDVDVLPDAREHRGADLRTNDVLRARLDPYTNSLPRSVEQTLADRYADLFRVFLKHRDAIERVTFWCVTDADSWLNYWPVSPRTSYPLLFDRQGRPKPAFDAVIAVGRKQ